MLIRDAVLWPLCEVEVVPESFVALIKERLISKKL